MVKTDVNVDELLSELSDLRANQELLEESMDDMAARYAELNWDLLEGYNQNGGLSLDKLKQLSKTLSDMAATNPLMKRAAQLRHGYVFGKGVVFKGQTSIAPRFQAVLDDPVNERLMFSVQGYEELNLAKFTDGNLFVLYNRSTKTFTRVPLTEIEAYVTDPDSSERIWFIKRTWSSNDKTKSVWYPVSTYTGEIPKKVEKNDTTPVSTNTVMFHETSSRQIGWALGVPDSLAAMSWAIAYSNYLKNNSTLVKAYAQFAYKVTNQTRRGLDNAAAKVARPGVGGTALQAVGTELAPVNATGSQVNFNNGQPLAAMVATSLGVSIIALLSSPGAASGSYGAAATLDAPTLIGMISIQDTWALFYRNVLKTIGIKDAEVEFPAIESDPVYRQIASLVQAYMSGGLHQAEFRAALLDLLDIENALEGLPKPDEFNGGHVPGDEAPPGDPVSRQGNQGAVAGGTNQGDTNNDARTDLISGPK
jgi:hypothetical protein